MSASLRADSSAVRCKFSAARPAAGFWRPGLLQGSSSSPAGRKRCYPRSSAPRRTSINMLQAIVAWSIHNRVVVVVLAVFLLVLGCYAAGHAKLDVFPEFAPPQVVIQTEAPGLSPGEVEQLVTLPIETAVNGISRLDLMRSQSIQGLSVITVIFLDGTSILQARQQVAERLSELAGQLPSGVRPPRLAPLTSSTGRL